MNASTFMDKQIMDLSSKSDLSINNNLNNNNNKDFIDLMNPQSEQEQQHESKNNSNNTDEILPNYDFHPIHRPSSTTTSAFHSDHSASAPLANAAATSAIGSGSRDWSTSLDSNVPNKHSSSPIRSYSSLDRVEHDKIIFEKSQNVNDSDLLCEIDRTMKKYTDGLMHAIDSLSVRLSQMESRSRHLEHFVDDLKVFVGNNHGSAEGKLRHLENILLEVQSGVQDLKDKQEIMEGHMQLAKLQLSKVEQSSELPNAIHQDHVHQAAGAASAPPQQSGLQQFTNALSQSAPSIPPPNALPSSQQNVHPPPPSMTSQFPPATLPPGPQRDAYFHPPSQSHETTSQQFQPLPPGQYQQPPPAPQSQPQPQPQPQQYQPAPIPAYLQPPQAPQQQHSSAVASNAAPPLQPSLGHRPDETPYVLPQTYPPSLHQHSSQPSSAPPPAQPYYGSPSPMYEPPPPARSSSSFPSAYIPPAGPSEQYPYGGPTPHYGSGSPMKPQPHSPRAGTGSYPQLPTARILPQAIPTASGISGGSGSGGSGNKVPIDDVVDKVTSMGFSREQVRATVRKLTENGQSVDLNVVLDKLMNDADVQPPRNWLGR